MILLEIRHFFNQTILIFFLFLRKNVCCGYSSLEELWQGASNEYLYICFCGEIRTILGPVVQSIVSLTSSLVVKILTVLVSTISNSQVFLLKNITYMLYLIIKALTIP